MNLHNDIMNIQINGNKSGLYRRGHRDARHAAAEIALKYDSIKEQFEEYLEELHEDLTFYKENGKMEIGDIISLRNRLEDVRKLFKETVEGM